MCGNGVREGTEPCDGEDLGTRTCASEGFHDGGELTCTASCTLDTSACRTLCGNGFVEPGEECDSGEVFDPGCTDTCTVNPGWSCSGEPSTCVRTCGNGVLDPGEACEGTDIGDATCFGMGAGYGLPGCTADCELDTSTCFSVVQIAPGYYHTCILDSLGRIWCWGENTFKQLGNGTNDFSSATPVRIPEITDATAVASGEFYSCALLSDGTVKCWGTNMNGELGSGSPSSSATPVAVPNVTEAVFITAGRNHVCAVLQTGGMRCWGSNFDGMLGNGSTTQPEFSVPVSGINNAVMAVAGENHTCALLSDHSVKCWGSNAMGQLGTGNTSLTHSTTPVAVQNLTDAEKLSAGGMHTCAVRVDGSVTCWGANANGELGNGTTEDSYSPVTTYLHETTTALTAELLACGEFFNCAASAEGLYCWGANDDSQLGGASTQNMVPGALAVPGVSGVSVLGAGSMHACAVIENNVLACWGDNSSSQCSGTANTVDHPTPVQFLTTM